MLVTFKSQSHGDITMFGTVAKSLLKMMGQSGNVPGAIMAAEVAAAKESLLDRLQTVEPSGQESSADANEEEGEAPVSLSTRAIPLLQMLDSAISSGDDVLWEE